ncbi:trypsin-like peptidase domain-containing protein [Candidatus Kaiserbacteria bacterium]|nr:trypsin-like peptidase domain-containing protein [Candidatus Kaiserbacteria bacterium]
MSAPSSSRILLIGALAIIVAVLVLLAEQPQGAPSQERPEASQVANIAATYEPQQEDASRSEIEQAPAPPPPPETPKVSEEPVAPLSSPTPDASVSSVIRIQNPYPTPPQSFLTINENTRLALVNILCVPEDAGLHATSGSGVIIDSRGVILTNAHVAQYVLLSQSERTNLSCVVRASAPAQIIGSVDVLYIPPIWIEKHAAEITEESPLGTGEHDYALLRITKLPDSRTTLPSAFPSLPIDTREAIGFPGDSVLAASYPSEFVSARATAFNLYPASSITSVKGLLTFENSVDLLSLAGVQEAQSGSSGGAVVNAWGFLIGIITTTSEGSTTAEREMRALTLSYIDGDMRTQSGAGIVQFLGEDTITLAERFKNTHENTLVELLIAEIEKRYNR